jgi:2-polyprenyl-3-methyl-5-hydroxy-6-metoxy-1,4-benzoquinol methylase
MEFNHEPGIQITLLNLAHPETGHGDFEMIQGDATDLSRFQDRAFDVVFANSVIEHVGDLSRQQQMADEIRRVGHRYFVQTPNYYFPLEPHFFLPGFQWLPMSWRVALLKNVGLGWYGRVRDDARARELVETTRLLKERELVTLFPDGVLHRERILGLVNSLVVYGGWETGIQSREEQP